MNNKLVVPLNEIDSLDLNLCGGKVYNLAKLQSSGFNVPGSLSNQVSNNFCVTTKVYDEWETSNKKLSPATEDLIKKHVAMIGSPSLLAIRSSATLEDAPGVSFAGQFESFLNVKPGQAVEKIVKCFESLSNPRSLAYRKANKIGYGKMAVLITPMVETDPVSGSRLHSVVEAVGGLAEDLVGGTRSAEDRINVVNNSDDLKSQTSPLNLTVLNEDNVQELVRVGQRVQQQLYNGQPQDIEFVVTRDEKIVLVQTRPITSLFPVTAVADPENPCIWWSLAVTQGTYAPWTPLGESVYAGLAQSAVHMLFGGFGGRTRDAVAATSKYFIQFPARRAYVNISPLLTDVVGKFMLGMFNSMGFTFKDLDQTTDAVFTHLRRTAPATRRSLADYVTYYMLVVRVLLYFTVVLVTVYVPAYVRGLWSPEAESRRACQKGEKLVSDFRQKIKDYNLEQLVDLFSNGTLTEYLRGSKMSAASVILGMRGLKTVQKLAPPHLGSYLVITRGVAHNPTAEMDKTLVELADLVVEHARNKDELALWSDLGTSSGTSASTAKLVEQWRQGTLKPTLVCQRLTLFFDRFGARCPGEIDMGRDRYRERPEPLFKIIQQLVSSKVVAEKKSGGGEAHYTVAAAAEADKYIADCLDYLKTNKSWWHWRSFRTAANRVRSFVGLRELPKFINVRLLDCVREKLKTHRLVVQAFGSQLDQLFPFLVFDDFMELHQTKGRVSQAMLDRIARRKLEFEKEQRRHQIPIVLVDDGRAFYDGWTDGATGNAENPNSTSQRSSGQWVGEGVSPGVLARGRVRVVHDPHDPNLVFDKGDVLVVRSSDPSWTVLFIVAGALVMEVGGALVHGAVTARELGIPAVVGVKSATRQLTDGDFISVNGTTGVIKLVD